MSAFILKTDYGQAIRDSVLDDITETDDAKLDTAEKRAIGFAKSFLAVRYDTAAIFSSSGEDRNPELVGVIVDLALYFLHQRLNPRKIPAHRKQAYDDGLKWLTDVRDGELLPDLPSPSEEEQKDLITYQGNPRRVNHV